jgi:hypothetical protein
MTARLRSVALAVIHVALVATLGAKLLLDRATRPRVWVRAVPVDPSLPIRGRYVSLKLMTDGTPTVAFFIPEHADDPSRRAAGEELWAEVTMPKRGRPRPIRLGVKKSDGTLTPLVF